ncbi:MAG: NADH-quinone oxidoreductase subunit J [Desulfobacterales bacterium]|jgi:NADH-quinone oxidoreductase subunit J|nr:NADH-quinone oxidoreductase subunit J [Desulfobacterales bacterium]
MQYLAYLTFGMYLFLVLGGGLVATGSRSIVRAFAGLLVALVGVAGLYFLMDAPFIALMQILIYIGAVCVIIFMAVMLTMASRGEGYESKLKSPAKRIMSMLAGAVMAFLLAGMVMKYPLASTVAPRHIPVAELGEALLGPYALAFELISVILFVAMVGAMVAVYERRK